MTVSDARQEAAARIAASFGAGPADPAQEKAESFAAAHSDPFSSLIPTGALLDTFVEQQIQALPRAVQPAARAQLAERKKAAKSAAGPRKPASEDAWTKLIGKLSDIERQAVQGALQNVEIAEQGTPYENEDDEDAEPDFTYGNDWNEAA